MSSATQTLWTSGRDRCDLVIGGKTITAQAEDFHTFLLKRCGEETANLFAKPVVRSDGTIEWVDRLGATQSVALSELPEQERNAVENNLRAQLAKIEPLAADDTHAALALAALVVEDRDAIRAADGRPILTGWGGFPPNISTSEAMERHHRQTLGPYLTLTDPPAPSLGLKGLPTSPPPLAADSLRTTIRAPLIATAVAAIVVFLLLLPGVLLRAASPLLAWPPQQSPINGDSANRALAEQIQTLETQLQGNVCRPSGQTLPRIETPQLSARPPAFGQSSSAQPEGGAALGSAERPLTPPVQPATTPVPREVAPLEQGGETQTLATLLNRATVLVLTENGTGTGFFVSPELVLTNRHVVDNSGGQLRVGNKSLGRMMEAELIAATPPGDAGEPDYGLLRLKDGTSPVFLSLATDLPHGLQNVIAAGFPGVMLRDDPDFLRLRRNNDLTSVPEIALTAGQVVQVQRASSPVPIIVHRASISPGNSGGPLADECGRVLGVNTYVLVPGGRQGEQRDASDRMHYALNAGSAVKFLEEQRATPRVVGGRCVVGGASDPAAPVAPPASGSPPPTNTSPGGTANPPQPGAALPAEPTR